jgi:YbgC/YbaW family acyl-CoA thioester hydrolase
MKIHVVDRRIMWGDLDPLGIVFYPRYYEWMDGCAHLFMESLGIPMKELLERRGIIFALVETRCRYHCPGRYHDSIRISTSLAELSSKAIVLRYRLCRMPQQELMAQGWERRICLDATDPTRLRAVEIPQDIKEILQPALETAALLEDQDMLTST